MKRIFHTLLALTAALSLQAQDNKWPEGRIYEATYTYSDTYSPGKNKIYRKGWIDFNKNGVRDIYENPAARLEDRIEDLLKQMTLEEKTCQLVTLYGYHRVLKDELPTPRWKTRLWKDGVGAIDEHLNSFYSSTKPAYQSEYTWPASKHAWALNTVQKWFVEETRLGIPVDFTNEGIHGNESLRSTGFPTPLGLGATWDKELLNEVGRVTGREARMMGYTNTYGPILDVIRDQRWGRCEESFGESPYLVAELGIQFTRGLQENVLSTGKHFLAYSNNKGAREAEARCDPQMSPRELEYIHAYVWRRVVSEAGLMGAMVSYNDYDGLPMASSHYWMVERLRNEWGFRGYIVSDSEAVEYLHTKHRTASSQKEAAAQSILGGMNVRCTFREPDTFVLPLREAIAEGMVPMAVIDDRVRDVLRAKFVLGLFDDPYQRDLKGADEEVEKAENQEVSLRASRESAVLLKNTGVLPLQLESLKRIAVVGPNATAIEYARNHYGPKDIPVVSPLEGIKTFVGDRATVSYVQGCDLVDANWPDSELFPTPLTRQEQAGIDEAVALARESDVVVAVMGGSHRTCGESRSRSSLDLPGRQRDLLMALHATGKSVVLVLINGRALSVNWEEAYLPAILEMWYPGPHGGTALAEVLFGAYNPGGKTTTTFPRSVGQIPFNFPYKPLSQSDSYPGLGPSGKAARVNGPLYPFGFGLSYTTFRYANLQLAAAPVLAAATDAPSSQENRGYAPQGQSSAASCASAADAASSQENRGDAPLVIEAGQSVMVSVEVTNTGDLAGDEVVQLYIKDDCSSVITYERQLAGFERIHLLPGETRTVTFTVGPDRMQLLDASCHWVVEPGTFTLFAGPSSEDLPLSASFLVR
ncbi:MAG: glycoside hydrolase family 3 N-terminal domain-containing protein [Bacteroidales bacterium]|nr:glycoside hydrolase family 3 N-terminal domain-containing protein [Bacteroidales bacterium]